MLSAKVCIMIAIAIYLIAMLGVGSPAGLLWALPEFYFCVFLFAPHIPDHP